MAVRAIRGATQLDADDRDHLLASVDELIREILEQNGLDHRRPHLDAVHGHAGPAQRVPGAGRPPARASATCRCCAPRSSTSPARMPRVIRVMVHVETALTKAEVRHVYLRGAAALRRDLAQ